MKRLTTNKDISEMGMFELAHNSCYSKDGKARYRDYNLDIDARELTRKLLKDHADGDDAFISNEDFDGWMMDYLQYGMDSIDGLIALFYRNLWAMADLRERLKEYEDLEEQTGIEIDKLYASIMEYIKNKENVNPEDTCFSLLDKEESAQYYKWLELYKQGKLMELHCRARETVYARLPGDNHFTVAEIKKIEIKPSVYGGICYFIEPVSRRGHLYKYFKDDFGKTIFFTLEEAEAALKGVRK